MVRVKANIWCKNIALKNLSNWPAVIDSMDESIFIIFIKFSMFAWNVFRILRVNVYTTAWWKAAAFSDNLCDMKNKHFDHYQVSIYIHRGHCVKTIISSEDAMTYHNMHSRKFCSPTALRFLTFFHQRSFWKKVVSNSIYGNFQPIFELHLLCFISICS